MKLCKLCHVNRREVPDRNKMGRPIKLICKKCHKDRLKDDIDLILKHVRLRYLSEEL